MYKIILVDDDTNTIEGIKKHIPLKELGIELVATAYNGKDGLEAIKKYQPDIIFSDIQMPQMTGFDMISCLKEMSFTPQIIMFTGFNDFDNAKLAINANVSSYLVKPTTPDEIIEALKKAVEACKEQKKAHAAIQHQIIKNLLFGYSYTEEDYKNFQKLYSIDLQNKYFCCILTSIAYLNSDEKESLISVFHNEFAGNYDIYNDISDKVICFLIVSSEHFTQEDIENSIKNSKSISEMNIFTTIGTVSNSVQSIPILYRQAADMQEYSFCFNNKGCISFDWANSAFAKYCRNAPRLDKKALGTALSSLNVDLLYDIIDNIKNHLEKTVIYDTLKTKMLVFEFCRTIIHPNIRTDLSYEDEQDDMWMAIKATASHSELFEYCFNIIADFKKTLQSGNTTSEQLIVNIMIKYIEDNYMKSISLISLSRRLYCSRNFLSTIFKNYSGVDFKSYLQHYRMKKAAELLLTTKDSLAVIAENVGYNDLKTFRTVFMKHFGMLPSEYRRNN